MLCAIPLSNSSIFPSTVNSMLVKPVILLPGRAKLETKPCPSGSITAARHISRHAVGVAGGPASVDAKIAAFCPPQFLQPLAQGRNACLSVRIVRSQHQDGEAPHTLRLLRARRERPRHRRAAEQRDELAAL